jgi:hypothetical protein
MCSNRHQKWTPPVNDASGPFFGNLEGRKVKVLLRFLALFHIVWVEIREDPGTAEATMEGLAFPSRPLRVAGPEETGRRNCLSFPANSRD